MDVQARVVDETTVDVVWRVTNASGSGGGASDAGSSGVADTTIQYKPASGILRPRSRVVAVAAGPDRRLRARVSDLQRHAYMFRVSSADGAWSKWTEAVTPVRRCRGHRTRADSLSHRCCCTRARMRRFMAGSLKNRSMRLRAYDSRRWLMLPVPSPNLSCERRPARGSR